MLRYGAKVFLQSLQIMGQDQMPSFALRQSFACILLPWLCNIACNSLSELLSGVAGAAMIEANKTRVDAIRQRPCLAETLKGDWKRDPASNARKIAVTYPSHNLSAASYFLHPASCVLRLL